jgi:hypothetical protein
MDKENRDDVKNVPYVIPCTYGESPTRRVLDTAQSISLLCIDIDNSTHARPYYNSPETLVTQLEPFNFALYTTASSTPDNPRVRLLVDASNVPVRSYRDATKDIAHRIGLPVVNKESITACLPMFLPTIFKGDTAEMHPLLIHRTNGRPYVASDIVQRNGDQEISTDQKFDATTGDELDFLRPSVEGIQLSDVEGALGHVDPDVLYPEWLEIAAALRHQFTSREDQEKAYALFDKWSSKGNKYVGSEDTAAKWKSLRPNPRGRVPVTIRSLLRKATEGGWDGQKVKERCYTETLTWLRRDHANELILVGDGLKRIAGTPLLTQSQQESLLNTVVSQAKKNHGVRLSLSALRRDLQAVKNAVRETEKKGKKEKLPTWCNGICYVAKINQFFRNSTVESFSPEALDRAYGNKLLPSEEQLKDMGDDSIGTRSRPIVKPQDYLLNVVQVPVAYDTLYDPSNPNDTFIYREGKVYVNTYVRNYPEPDAALADYAEMILMEHLTNLVKEPEYRRTILDFLAYIVQNPGAKIRWAVLIQGAQGCGKTFLAEMMKVVLGRGHVASVDSESLRGTWNEWSYGSQLVTLEEVRVVGQNRHDVMNRLKPLISNDVITVNQRFRDTRSLDNKTNYLLFTNHHDALAVTAGDRRYFVVKSPLQTKAQVAALGEEYFTRLFDLLRTHAAGLRHFLENHHIAPTFLPNGHAPITTYLRELIDDTAGEVAALVRDVMADSTNPLVKPDLLSSATLLSMLEAGGALKVSAQHLARVLREEGYASAGRVYMENGERHPLWVRIEDGPAISEAKDLIEKRLSDSLAGDGLL